MPRRHGISILELDKDIKKCRLRGIYKMKTHFKTLKTFTSRTTLFKVISSNFCRFLILPPFSLQSVTEVNEIHDLCTIGPMEYVRIITTAFVKMALF
jgi:hypothetical protein